MEQTTRRTATVHEIVPLLFVDDIERSIRFYRDGLGFSVVGTWAQGGMIAWCRLERDGASLMLQQATDEDAPAEHRGRGVDFYFICDDSHAIHRELTERGLNPAPPADAFYGMTQVFVKDPDGYALCFESPATARDGSERSAAVNND